MSVGRGSRSQPWVEETQGLSSLDASVCRAGLGPILWEDEGWWAAVW